MCSGNIVHSCAQCSCLLAHVQDFRQKFIHHLQRDHINLVLTPPSRFDLNLVASPERDKLWFGANFGKLKIDVIKLLHLQRDSLVGDIYIDLGKICSCT